MPKAKLAKIPERWSQAIAVGRWLRQRAENVSALLLLAMFLCFILQIAARYVFNRPLGWTDEVSVLCWIWCTLWGAAFVLRERDEVRFDIIYSSVSAQTRRVFTIITGIAAVILFGIALPAVFSYIDDIEHWVRRTVRRLRGQPADPHLDDDLREDAAPAGHAG